MQGTPTVLLADADVLIDYRESELVILELVAQHLGRQAVVEADRRKGPYPGVQVRIRWKIPSVVPYATVRCDAAPASVPPSFAAAT